MKRALALTALVSGLALILWSTTHSTTRPNLRVAARTPAGSTEVKHAPPTNTRTTPTLANAAPVTSEVDTILKLQSCYEAQTCAYPQEDPHSYEMALGHDIQARLLHFAQSHAGDPSAKPELRRLAQAFISNSDPFVQEACLTIFANLPIEEENLSLISSALKDSADPEVMAQTLAEMTRYLGSPWEAQVHAFLSEVVARGGQMASETAALEILPFVSERSLPTYQETLKGMDRNTIAYSHLDSALQEFQRLQSGG